MTQSLLNNTDKPEYNVRKIWSDKLKNGGAPTADDHVEYFIIRGLMAKYPETIEQQAKRFEKAFQNCYRYSYVSTLWRYRYLSSGRSEFCSSEMYQQVRARAAELYEYFTGPKR